jgi:hypothetical protein
MRFSLINTRMKVIATAVLVLFYIVLHSQTVLNVYLTDLYKKPVPFAIIKYQDATFNCNNLGFFRVNNYKLGTKIIIHKLGFADTTVLIAPIQIKADTLSLFVTLRLNPAVLPEVSISSALIQEINPMKADFVSDYELKGEYLIELLSDDNILLINAENKLKSRYKPIRGIEDILKDSYGNVYIVADKIAFKIRLDSSFIKLDTIPIELAKLNWQVKYCDDVIDTSLFLRRYKDNNQTIAFFAISSLNTKHVRLLKEITDIDRKNSVAVFANESNGFNQYVASLGLSAGSASTLEELQLVRKAERMADMLEMHYTLPAYSLLKLINDSIYLFAHDIDTMFVYDRVWNLIKSKRINYHHLKIWDKELFINEEKTKVYAKLVEKSKPMIAEIDLQTGALKPPYTIIKSKFPTKIKIRNNVVYFMARQNNGPGYTVYSQNLQLSH